MTKIMVEEKRLEKKLVDLHAKIANINRLITGNKNWQMWHTEEQKFLKYFAELARTSNEALSMTNRLQHNEEIVRSQVDALTSVIREILLREAKLKEDIAIEVELVQHLKDMSKSFGEVKSRADLSDIQGQRAKWQETGVQMAKISNALRNAVRQGVVDSSNLKVGEDAIRKIERALRKYV